MSLPKINNSDPVSEQLDPLPANSESLRGADKIDAIRGERITSIASTSSAVTNPLENITKKEGVSDLSDSIQSTFNPLHFGKEFDSENYVLTEEIYKKIPRTTKRRDLEKTPTTSLAKKRNGSEIKETAQAAPSKKMKEGTIQNLELPIPFTRPRWQTLPAENETNFYVLNLYSKREASIPLISFTITNNKGLENILFTFKDRENMEIQNHMTFQEKLQFLKTNIDIVDTSMSQWLQNLPHEAPLTEEQTEKLKTFRETT